MQTQETKLALDMIQWAEGLALLILFVVALTCLWMGARLIRGLGKFGARKILYRRHWGGFGGDSSGWQLSAPLVATTLGVVLIAIGVSLATSMLFVLHQHEIVKPPVAANKQDVDDKEDAANKAGASGKPKPDKPGAAAPANPPPQGETEQEEEPARAPASAS